MLLALPIVIGIVAFAFGGNAAVIFARSIVITAGILALLVVRAIVIGM